MPITPETDKLVREKESDEEFARSRELFREADRLRYETRSQTLAEIKYREAMGATGDYGVHYHLAQGQIYSMYGSLEPALTEFEIAAEINEELPPDDQVLAVFINLGLTYRKLSGRYKSLNETEKADEMIRESIEIFERAHELAPTDPGVLNGLAMTHLKIKDNIDEVEKYSSAAYALNSLDYESLCGMSQVYRSAKFRDKAQAVELAQKAIELFPDRPFAYGLLGGMRDFKDVRLEDSPKKAIHWLKKAIALEPQNSFTLSELGRAYRELQLYDDAIEFFDKAIKADTEGEQKYGVLTNRGNAYRLASNKEPEDERKEELYLLAEADLRNALAVKADFNPALLGLRDLLEARKRHEEALDVAGRLNLGLEKNQQAFSRLQKLYENDRRQSRSITQDIVKDRSELASDEIRDKAAYALKLDSKNAQAWGILGRYFENHKQYEEARQHLEQSAFLYPHGFTFRLALGRVLERLKQWEGAAREYSFCAEHAREPRPGQEGLRRVRPHLRSDEPKETVKTGDAEIVFPNDATGRKERHSVETIRSFLADRINDWNLPIKEIIDEIGSDPVFIIAKTGVGKTVTVPTKILLSLCDDLLSRGVNISRKSPQVYVVEPRIPICTMMMAEMNDGYQDYLAYKLIDTSDFHDFVIGRGVAAPRSKSPDMVNKVVELAYDYVATGKALYNPRHFNLYGCITSGGKINGNAPILFVTTGIMESLTFEASKLDPNYHRIIIDEAHVTIEANPAIELGIGLARKRGVKIDYMSATVDPGTLAEDLGVKILNAGASRFPLHLSNLRAPLEDRVVHLVEKYLIEPDESIFPDPSGFPHQHQENIERIRLHLLSQDDFSESGRVYPGLRNRPQGMLIIVNSHQNENSDTQKIANLINRAAFNRNGNKVHVLRLASPIVRDPEQKLAFDRLVRKIEDDLGRYVIVATNVVEMGLTFSSLDYVVTMDSEFDNEYVDGSQMIRKVELGVNALYQRIGRAGRLRPGMAFVAKDFGASYADLSDTELAEGLRVAPIRYPLAKGSFLKLALYSFRERIPEDELREAIASLQLPSRIHDDESLWSRFLSERDRLRRIGIAHGDSLTSVGKRSLGFIGLEDMDFARLLAEVFEDQSGKGSLPIIFTVFAAASEFGFADIMDRRAHLTNPKQLSAVEIFHTDVLGISIERAREIIGLHEGDREGLRSALSAEGVDEQVCSDIQAYTAAGFKLANRRSKRGEDIFVFGGVNSDAADDSSDEDDWEEEEEDIADEIPELAGIIDGYVNHPSTDETLGFERAAVGFSDQCDLVNIYRIFAYFFNNYFSHLNSGTLGRLEASEVRRRMADEASKLQLKAKVLADLNSRFTQLLRHVGIRIYGGRESAADNIKLARKDVHVLRDVVIRELLIERDGGDRRFELCRTIFDLRKGGGGREQGRSEPIERTLRDHGFSVGRAEVEELENLIIKEAVRRLDRELDRIEFVDFPPQLPFIPRGLEKKILEILRRSGYHHRLTLDRDDFGFATNVIDQAGNSIRVVLKDENTPLETALDGKESVTIFGKLTPRLVPRDVRDESGDGFATQLEKVFTLSHVTLAN